MNRKQVVNNLKLAILGKRMEIVNQNEVIDRSILGAECILHSKKAKSSEICNL
jgi:hypothetical protein